MAATRNTSVGEIWRDTNGVVIRADPSDGSPVGEPLGSTPMKLFAATLVGSFVVWGCGKPADAPVVLESPPPSPPPAPVTAVAPSGAAITAAVTNDGEPTAGPVDAGPFVSRCTGVSLVMVSAKPSKYAVDIVLELRNTGSAPVELMTTDDGSCHGMRNPAVSFDLVPNQRAVQARCGNVNGLADHDFVTLTPGMHHKLEWIHGPTPAKPGRYSVTATFENDPNADILRGVAAPPAAELVKRARATVACKVVSNTLSFEWK